MGSRERDYIHKVKQSGMLAIICGAIQITIIALVAVISILSAFLYPYIHFDSSVISGLAFPILCMVVAILQIIILIRGLSPLISETGTGKTMRTFAFIFLGMFIISIPISLIFFWDLITWGPFGMFNVNLPDPPLLLSNPINLFWFLFMSLISFGSASAFGILIMIIDKKYMSGDLKVPGLFFALQGLPYISCCTIFMGTNLIEIFLVLSIIPGGLALIGYFIFGANLRKIY